MNIREIISQCNIHINDQLLNTVLYSVLLVTGETIVYCQFDKECTTSWLVISVHTSAVTQEEHKL